eukprot:987755_1
MEEKDELQQLREENQILNQKLMQQYAINNKLQKHFTKIQEKNPDNQHYNFESEHSASELEPLAIALAVGDEDPKKAASTVNLSNKIKGGAFVLNCCKFYAIRIYVHYWIWQIPIFIINIILCSIWLSDHDINTELGFLAVGPVFFATLIRDKIFSWVIYWSIKKTICCSKYGRYHICRLADCIG